MSRAVDTLRAAADRHWPGSASAFADIYICLSAERGGDLAAAALIGSALAEVRERSAALRDLRRRVERAKPARRGPKMDRYVAAVAALDVLDALLAAERVWGRADERGGA